MYPISCWYTYSTCACRLVYNLKLALSLLENHIHNSTAERFSPEKKPCLLDRVSLLHFFPSSCLLSFPIFLPFVYSHLPAFCLFPSSCLLSSPIFLPFLSSPISLPFCLLPSPCLSVLSHLPNKRSPKEREKERSNLQHTQNKHSLPHRAFGIQTSFFFFQIMKIGCLQFAPKLGQVQENMRKADSLLQDVLPGHLDLLVLPEMAFSGEF
jgi:hypothetical protein